MSSTKIVKRYANRKLYDTERSCYVTLEDISEMIKGGDEVQVIDNKSGDDLTSVTLAQIIFETEKKAHFMPLNLLRGLIQQSGESIGGFARDQVETVQTQAQQIQTQAQQMRDQASDTVTRITSQFGETVGRVIGAGEEDAEAPPQTEEPPKTRSPASVKEMLSTSQKSLEEIQRGIEDRIQDGLGVVSEGFSREVEDVLSRLGSLKERFRK